MHNGIIKYYFTLDNLYQNYFFQYLKPLKQTNKHLLITSKYVNKDVKEIILIIIVIIIITSKLKMIIKTNKKENKYIFLT